MFFLGCGDFCLYFKVILNVSFCFEEMREKINDCYLVTVIGLIYMLGVESFVIVLVVLVLVSLFLFGLNIWR